LFEESGLDPNEVYILVHSGSRTVGESVLGAFLEEHKGAECQGAEEDSEEFKNYIEGHNRALNFAKRNRFLIAHRILSQILFRKKDT
jgi:release factor H-coupled RctB family protein